MNSLDLLALAVMVVALVQALSKGPAAELTELAFAGAGLLVALLFYEELGTVLQSVGMGNPTAVLTGFVIIFLLFIILGELGSSKVKKTLNRKGLSWRDRIWGVPLGLLRGFIINSVLFLLLLVFPVNPYLIGTSSTAPFFLSGAGIIRMIAPRDFKLLIPVDTGGRMRFTVPGGKKSPGKDKDEGKGDPDENRIEKI